MINNALIFGQFYSTIPLSKLTLRRLGIYQSKHFQPQIWNTTPQLPQQKKSGYKINFDATISKVLSSQPFLVTTIFFYFAENFLVTTYIILSYAWTNIVVQGGPLWVEA